MKHIGMIVPVLLVLLGSEAARAEETKTALTIDSVQVVAVGDKWEITVSGKVSLSKGDKFSSYKFFFNDPAGKEVVAIYRPFYPPKSGKTSTYTVFCTTDVKGGWSFSGEIHYLIDGKKEDKAYKMEKFNVPQN